MSHSTQVRILLGVAAVEYVIGSRLPASVLGIPVGESRKYEGQEVVRMVTSPNYATVAPDGIADTLARTIIGQYLLDTDEYAPKLEMWVRHCD